MISINTTEILQAEMDRKAFLRNAGIAFAGIIGVTTFVKGINGMAGQDTPANKALGNSYSASVYGGELTSGK